MLLPVINVIPPRSIAVQQINKIDSRDMEIKQSCNVIISIRYTLIVTKKIIFGTYTPNRDQFMCSSPKCNND